MNFNIGDIIIGNEHNYYGITNRVTLCEVVEMLDRNIIRVEVLGGAHRGARYTVDANVFDLVERNQSINFSADEWMKFMTEE